jgi:hypothetical protein
MRRALLALIAFLTFGAAFGQTPNLNVIRMNGGITPAYQCNYTLGALCGGESYSTTSLHTVTDKTGAITYAANNLLMQSNALGNAVWGTQGATKTGGFADPFGGTTAYQIAITSNTGNNFYQSSTSNGWGTSNVNILGTTWVKGTNGQQIYFNSNTSQGSAGATLLTFNGSWQQVAANVIPGSGAQSYFAFEIYNRATPASPLPNVTFQIYAPTVSAVTYETTPRLGQNGPNDAVITTSAAYYGAPFDWTYGTGAAGLGLRVEESRTNLYLNSTVPATQTVTVANATQYTVSFYGTGTLVASNACTFTLTGSAGALSSATCTSATTSLVLTPTALTATAYPQVEAGGFATSRILTGASNVTRAADVVSLTGFALAVLMGAQGAVILETGGFNNSPSSALVNFNYSAGLDQLAPFSITQLSFYKSGYKSTTTIGHSGTTAGVLRSGMMWTPSNNSVVGNGGSVGSSMFTITPGTNMWLGSLSGTSSFIDGHITKLALYNRALTASQLQARTVLGSPF